MQRASPSEHGCAELRRQVAWRLQPGEWRTAMARSLADPSSLAWGAVMGGGASEPGVVVGHGYVAAAARAGAAAEGANSGGAVTGVACELEAAAWGDLDSSEDEEGCSRDKTGPGSHRVRMPLWALVHAGEGEVAELSRERQREVGVVGGGRREPIQDVMARAAVARGFLDDVGLQGPLLAAAIRAKIQQTSGVACGNGAEFDGLAATSAACAHVVNTLQGRAMERGGQEGYELVQLMFRSDELLRGGEGGEQGRVAGNE